MQARGGELLCLVLHADPAAWTRCDAQDADLPGDLVGSSVMEAAGGLAAAHVAFARENRLALLTFATGASKQVLPLPGADISVSSVTASVCHAAISDARVVAFGESNSHADLSSSSSSSGAAAAVAALKSPTLSSVSSLSTADSAGASGLASALCRAMLLCRRFQRESAGQLACRVLVLSAEPDSAGMAVSVLNAAFACKDARITVDVASATAPERSVYLQQAAHESGGCFCFIDSPARRAPLQFLISSFGMSRADREVMLGPRNTSVDLRATCLASGKRVDIAHVCFVCLAVFEEMQTECPVCHTKATPAATSLPTASASSSASCK